MPRITRDRIIHSSKPKSSEPIPVAGGIEFNEPEPPIQVCDQLLGRYLREWDQLERALFDIFQKMLGTHESAARIIVSSISGATLREILVALAGQRLFKKDCETFEALLEREKKAATKRNRLVHGNWRLHITKNADGPNTATWERFYEPSDPRLLDQMHGKHKKQKVCDDHIFSAERIVEIIRETEQLTNEIKDFAKSVSLAPFLYPRPLASSSPPNEK